MKSTKVYYWMPLAAALLLAGCHKDPAQVVQQRAVERWNLLIGGQPSKAYEYLSPGYRATHTLDQYVAAIAMARVKWTSAKVKTQTCDAEVCTVEMEVESTLPASMAHVPQDIPMQTPVTEQWVAADGQWYFRPDSAVPRVKPAGPDAAAMQREDTPSGAPPQNRNQ